jgi:hypothetical protein
MGNWEGMTEKLYIKERRRRRRRTDLCFGCVTLHCRIFDLTDLSCGRWDTQLGEEW